MFSVDSEKRILEEGQTNTDCGGNRMHEHEQPKDSEQSERKRFVIGKNAYLVFDGVYLEGEVPLGSSLHYLSRIRIPRTRIIDMYVGGFFSAYNKIHLIALAVFGLVISWSANMIVAEIATGFLILFHWLGNAWGGTLKIKYEGGSATVLLPIDCFRKRNRAVLNDFVKTIRMSKSIGAKTDPIFVSRNYKFLYKWLIVLFLLVVTWWSLYPRFKPSIEIEGRRSMIEGGVIIVKNISDSVVRGSVRVDGHLAPLDINPGESSEFGVLQLGATIKPEQTGVVTLEGVNWFGRLTYGFQFVGSGESMRLVVH